MVQGEDRRVTYEVNPLTVFYDERCRRWVDIVQATGAWRFVSRASVERALADIDRWFAVTTFLAGVCNQHRQRMEKVRLPA